jgi:hypothetical protein
VFLNLLVVDDDFFSLVEFVEGGIESFSVCRRLKLFDGVAPDDGHVLRHPVARLLAAEDRFLLD